MKRGQHILHLKMDAKLWRELKRYCQHEDVPLEEFITKVLSEWIREKRSEKSGKSDEE